MQRISQRGFSIRGSVLFQPSLTVLLSLSRRGSTSDDGSPRSRHIPPTTCEPPPYSILTSHREMRLIPTSTSRKTGPSQRSGFIHHYYPTSVDPRTTEMFHFARFAENSFLPAARIQRFTIFDHVSCPTNPDVSSHSFFADSTHSLLLGRRESNPLMRGSKPRAFPLGYAPLPGTSYPRWESNPQPSVFETDAST